MAFSTLFTEVDLATSSSSTILTLSCASESVGEGVGELIGELIGPGRIGLGGAANPKMDRTARSVPKNAAVLLAISPTVDAPSQATRRPRIVNGEVALRADPRNAPAATSRSAPQPPADTVTEAARPTP